MISLRNYAQRLELNFWTWFIHLFSSNTTLNQLINKLFSAANINLSWKRFGVRFFWASAGLFLGSLIGFLLA